jgi:hypothetical protein
MVEQKKVNQIKSDIHDNNELDTNISKTSKFITNYDMTRRRLSAEANNEKAQWSLRQREANRRIVDTRNNLEGIYQRQRNLNEEARLASQERKAKEIESKIEVRNFEFIKINFILKIDFNTNLIIFIFRK